LEIVMVTEQMESARLLKPDELATVIRLLRELRRWSQETLATLSGLSVRTVQRVERGEASDLDTRRALAQAFDSEDIDVFNKPHDVPTPEGLKAEKEKFDREHLTLDARVVTSGRELATLYHGSTMDTSEPAIDLKAEPAVAFAGLVDYLRDWRDCADLYTETDKLDVYEELQRYLDKLDAAGIAVCYARRETKLVSKDWIDKTPWSATLLYISAFPKDQPLKKLVVPRKMRIG